MWGEIWPMTLSKTVNCNQIPLFLSLQKTAKANCVKHTTAISLEHWCKVEHCAGLNTGSLEWREHYRFSRSGIQLCRNISFLELFIQRLDNYLQDMLWKRFLFWVVGYAKGLCSFKAVFSNCIFQSGGFLPHNCQGRPSPSSNLSPVSPPYLFYTLDF